MSSKDCSNVLLRGLLRLGLMFRRVCSPASPAANGRRIGVALLQVAAPPVSSTTLVLILLRPEELKGLAVRLRLCSGDSLGNLTEVRF